ncbi:MAG: response regulator transcription factor [Aquabacterium sp.]
MWTSLVLDLSMPGIHGLTLLQELVDLPDMPPIVVLSMHNEGQIVQRAIKIGAAGYVTKESDPERLLAAIRRVMSGGKYIDPALMDSLATSLSASSQAPHESLSSRELQVLQLIVSGHQIGDIATMLELSPKTVSTHKMRIMQKLHVGNNADLVRYALRHGIG